MLRLKPILKAILPSKIQIWLVHIRNLYITRFHTKSYAQQGEDLILREMLAYAQSGFYVDVGAHHPFRFSNTYLFYKQGWRGINIDAMPGSMKLFDRFRPRDINIQCGVAYEFEKQRGGGQMIYYSFNEPALNGFTPLLETKYANHPLYHLLEKIPVSVRTLEDILDEYMPRDTNIDFLSIDVEGLDLEVLKSHNFTKYRPKIILIESWDTTLETLPENETYHFLKERGYLCVAKTINTLIFKEKA